MTTLIESGARPYGSTKGVALSVLLHGGLIAAAIFGTAAVVLPPREKVEEHPILYVAPPPPPAVHVAPDPLPEVKAPPKAKAPAQRRPEPPRPVAPQPKIATPTPAPVAPPVAAALPAIDLKAPPAIGDIVAAPAPDRIASSGISRGGSVKSDDDAAGSGGLGSGSSARAYSENEVERAVEVTRAPEPRYPDALKSVGVEGVVAMRFIVGTNGRVETGSISVISSPNKLFSDAVRAALANARYRPAQAGGHAVRQLVEQSFQFRLEK